MRLSELIRANQSDDLFMIVAQSQGPFMSRGRLFYISLMFIAFFYCVMTAIKVVYASLAAVLTRDMALDEQIFMDNSSGILDMLVYLPSAL
jgi:hypothetical protein